MVPSSGFKGDEIIIAVISRDSDLLTTDTPGIFPSTFFWAHPDFTFTDLIFFFFLLAQLIYFLFCFYLLI